MTDILIKIIPLVPAFSVVIAALGLCFAAYSLRRQWRSSAMLVRYEAVRNKRSAAKALRWEIAVIEKALPDRNVKPNLYHANADQVGRMSDAAIETSVKFYAYVDGNPDIQKADATQKANAAIQALDLFLKESSSERRELDDRIKL